MLTTTPRLIPPPGKIPRKQLRDLPQVSRAVIYNRSSWKLLIYPMEISLWKLELRLIASLLMTCKYQVAKKWLRLLTLGECQTKLNRIKTIKVHGCNRNKSLMMYQKLTLITQMLRSCTQTCTLKSQTLICTMCCSMTSIAIILMICILILSKVITGIRTS